MGLIQSEIQELRGLVAKILNDEIPDTKVNSLIAVYSQINKRTNQLLQIEKLNISAGGRDKSWKRMESLNVVDCGEVIELGSEGGNIKCQAMGGKIICRDDCLDYSGQHTDNEDCRSCEHFSTTRKKLLPR